MLDVLAGALKLVESIGEVGGVLVASADILDDLVLPGSDDVAVALVDPRNEPAVVRRSPAISGSWAGDAAVVVGHTVGRPRPTCRGVGGLRP